MTEAAWLASTNPNPMLEFLRGKASDRKLRLFAVASCRRMWSFLTTPSSREAVEMSERRADDPSFHKKMVAAGRSSQGVPMSELGNDQTTVVDLLRVLL
jgi:hypothetical protein